LANKVPTDGENIHMVNRRNLRTPVQNRNATIRTRETRNGKLRTETFRRDDDSISVAVSTDPKSDSTSLFVDFPDASTVRFDGRQARTLYRILQKHYQNTNKSF
jgi:hypothetical protein